MKSPLLTNEVWAQLDPRAGALTRRERRKVVLGLILAVSIALGAGAVAKSGLVWPNLSSKLQMISANSQDHTFVAALDVYDNGWRSERIVGIDSPSPGLRITGYDTLPITLSGESGVQLTVHFAVTDCQLATENGTAITVRVHRPWGAVAVKAHEDTYVQGTAQLACDGSN